MSSLQSLASSSGISLKSSHAPFDFVSSDFDDLASHMSHCAASRSRWFALRSNLQSVHAMAAGRLVTLACIAAVIGTIVFTLA
jgi:hypothetical protein